MRGGGAEFREETSLWEQEDTVQLYFHPNPRENNRCLLESLHGELQNAIILITVEELKWLQDAQEYILLSYIQSWRVT